MVESLLAIGLLVPGVAMLFALAALAGSGLMDMETMLVWAFVGAVLGDGISFQVGAKLQTQVRGSWPFDKHPDWLEKGERFFSDYGGLSIALGRFVGPIRPIIPAVAGMMEMSPWRFYSINIVSAVPWAFLYMVPGFLTGAALNSNLPDSFYWLLTSLIFAAFTIAVITKQIDLVCQKKDLLLAAPLGMILLINITLGLFTVMDFSGQMDEVNLHTQQFLSRFNQTLVVYSFSLVTWLGSLGLLWAPLLTCYFALIWQKDISGIKTVSLGLLGMEAMLWAMKWLIDKPRPGNFDGFDQFSYPSGHTTQATFVWLLAVFLFTRGRKWLVKVSGYSLAMLLILLVALSRLMLEVHWLGDVIAGLLVGSLWFYIVVVLERSRT
nr:VTT domain-containing protein [Endozoicomonas sp. OPT23]